MSQGPGTAPWALSMAGAVSGVLIGFTLSEAAVPGYSRLPGAYWIGTITGVVLGLAVCVLFSPYVQVARLAPLKHAVASGKVGTILASAALGLCVAVVSMLLCAVTGSWTFTWPVFGLCAATAPVYGGIAGLGAVMTGAYHRPP